MMPFKYFGRNGFRGSLSKKKNEGNQCAECKEPTSKKREVVCKGCCRYFCDRHCNKPVRLSAHGVPDPQGLHYNVCGTCYKDLNMDYSGRNKPEYQAVAQNLERRLSSRPDKNALLSQNIIKTGNQTVPTVGEEEKTDAPNEEPCLEAIADGAMSATELALAYQEERRSSTEYHVPSAEVIRRRISNHIENRPTPNEMVCRGILKPSQTRRGSGVLQGAQASLEQNQLRDHLNRKLSDRPNIEVLIEKRILFDQTVKVVEAHSSELYNRSGDKPWTRLTPKDKADIKKELNDFKANEMVVHDDSKQYTRFHK
eukprot:comp8366_c0_seq1/m.3740 comp8366_c0_seq1/g.3740  ORF comp8366_c0_seq1/g.3740 comp8366_c0_seq1/m.3740 type:complete len:312 (-) comp8366_c0_seq1:751-1686(-)